MVDMMEARPPYVEFETRAVEDRNASIEQGTYVARDVDFALITPMGSKDITERQVHEWFEKLRQDVREDRFPREWLKAYEGVYADWKEGRETPLDGTAVATCPIFSPAQVKMLVELKIKTVEDMAVANEETLNRLGMGSHDLKAKAKAFLAAAQDKGKLAAKVAALETENTSLKEDNDRLRSDVKEIDDRLKALEGGKPVKRGKSDDDEVRLGDKL